MRSVPTFATLVLAVSALAPVRADAPGPGGGGKRTAAISGEQIYRNVCQSCHMADARGATGAAAIPALANNPNLASADYPIAMVTNGRGAMPWFTDMLTPAQIAAVIGYVRTNFGNDYREPVTTAEVAAAAGPPPTEH